MRVNFVICTLQGKKLYSDNLHVHATYKVKQGKLQVIVCQHVCLTKGSLISSGLHWYVSAQCHEQ